VAVSCVNMVMYHEFRIIRGLSRTDGQLAVFHDLCSIQCISSYTPTVNVENINTFLQTETLLSQSRRNGQRYIVQMHRNIWNRIF
jgi:hypothetical protein